MRDSSESVSSDSQLSGESEDVSVQKKKQSPALKLNKKSKKNKKLKKKHSELRQLLEDNETKETTNTLDRIEVEDEGTEIVDQKAVEFKSLLGELKVEG